MSNVDEDINPYELLDVPLEATEQEIRTAYRKRSLKVHPDRVGIFYSSVSLIFTFSDSPFLLIRIPIIRMQASIEYYFFLSPSRYLQMLRTARKFHELNQAYELLLDPLRRLALDAKMRIKQARKERFKGYDAKRKNLVEDLEERERAFKKARVEKQKEEVEQWQATEKIKDEGRRLREEREKELRAREQDSVNAKEDQEQEDVPPALSESVSFYITVILISTLRSSGYDSLPQVFLEITSSTYHTRSHCRPPCPFRRS